MHKFTSLTLFFHSFIHKLVTPKADRWRKIPLRTSRSLSFWAIVVCCCWHALYERLHGASLGSLFMHSLYIHRTFVCSASLFTRVAPTFAVADELYARACTSHQSRMSYTIVLFASFVSFVFVAHATFGRCALLSVRQESRSYYYSTL